MNFLVSDTTDPLGPDKVPPPNVGDVSGLWSQALYEVCNIFIYMVHKEYLLLINLLRRKKWLSLMVELCSGMVLCFP